MTNESAHARIAEIVKNYQEAFYPEHVPERVAKAVLVEFSVQSSTEESGVDVEPAKPTGMDDTAMAKESEEGRQWRLQRKYDQAELIEWILHYKNPADDETKLRQIRLVLE